MKRKLQFLFACLFLVGVWSHMPVRAAFDLPYDSAEARVVIVGASEELTVRFGMAAMVVAEDEERAVVPVSLSAPPRRAVTVTVSARGGTATVGEDVALDVPSATVTFRPDAAQTQAIVLPVRTDEEVEGVEYLDLTLQSDDASVGVPERLRLWIRDTALYSDLHAEALTEQLRADFEPASMLGAEQAADTLLSVVWSDTGNVRGVFTGAAAIISTKHNPQGIAREQGVVVGSVWPAPLEDDTARRDLHLLMPMQTEMKGVRQNERDVAGMERGPAAEAPPYLRPRDAIKGDVARALLYFYTFYSSQADAQALERLESMLTQWMDDDPVDIAELRRNALIARYQGNPNPFVIAPELAERAFNLRGSYPTPTVSFVRQRASASEADSMAVIEVGVTGMGDADLTFDLVFDEAASTVEANDLSGFQRRTVTVPAGTPDGTVHRIEVPVERDEQNEETEQAAFVLENLSGFAEVAKADRYRLDIENAEPPRQEERDRVTLGPAYPNPLSPGSGSTVRFDLSIEEAVPFTVEVFSTLGQRVHVRNYSAGEAERVDAIEVDGEDLPSGLYIVRLRGPSFSTTETFVVVR